MPPRGGRILAAAIALAAILASGCGSTPVPVPSPTAGPNDPSLTPPPGGVTAGPAEPGEPSATAAPQPSVPAPGLAAAGLSCGDPDGAFPAAVLDQPPNAEVAADAPTEALRQYLRTADVVAQGWPAAGWRVIERSATRVTWIAPGGSTWWIATFQPQGGDWSFWEGGECHLQVALPDAVGFASWELDPARPPGPDARTIHVLGTELACANGDPPVGRVLAPVVLTTTEAVTIALVVRHVPGGADCPGNPAFPQDVTLPDPLGGRQLFDGSTVPPTARS